MPKIDRTGEINYNNFGSKMIICRYNGVRNNIAKDRIEKIILIILLIGVI